VTDPKPQKADTRRALLVLGASLLVLLGLAVGVAALLIPRFIEREVIAQARAQGVELELGELDYGWEWAEIKNAKARLIGVRGLRIAFQRVLVDLDGTKPERFEFTGLNVEADGSLPALALDLGAWTKRFPSFYALPLSAAQVAVEWRPEAGRPPWLSLRNGTAASAAGATVVAAENAHVAGANVGRVGATWSKTATNVALGLGEPELAKAPLRVDVDVASARPKLRLTLAPTPLERLAAPFAIELPVKDVTGSVEVELEFASQEAALPERGHAKGELKGWIPPHPAELDGFVFGDTTLVETDLALAPNGTDASLTNTRIVAGKFALAGGGALTREAAELKLHLDLTGALPCDALASAAAASRLGKLLGREAGEKAGALAKRVVGGSVNVRVQVNASTRDLAAAEVSRSLGIGCGLRPLTLEDLLKLGETVLPQDLSKLPEELGKLGVKVPEGGLAVPSGLPPLPSRLPPLPSGFPRLPSAFPGFPPLPSASPAKKPN
jgi:ADP-dependent NAD(P)H-hydrate dehydratase / NAD(P)H-hydrate epimerase